MIAPVHRPTTNGNALSPGKMCPAQGPPAPFRLRTALADRYIDAIVGQRNTTRHSRHGELRCPFSNTYAKSAGTSSRPWFAAKVTGSSARNAAAIGWRSGSRCPHRPRSGAAPERARQRPCPPWAVAAPPASRVSAAEADRPYVHPESIDSNVDRPSSACRSRTPRSDSSRFNGRNDYMRPAARNDCIESQALWTSASVRTMLLFANVAQCCASFRGPNRDRPGRSSPTPLEFRSRLRPMDQNRNRE